MKIPFDFSIDDWLERFQRLFEIVANFLKEAFGINLFTEDDQVGNNPIDVD